ncbi:MAG: methyltransferase domain-containing protein [Alphaproteobacteria bacterium]|nr:methyltransferase domain-containing protein [Alphaproteobacteria bacterium]
MGSLAPVALFAYRRPDHLRATVESLARNSEAPHTGLTIFCDGARGEQYRADVAAVRAYAAQVTGFASLEVVERPRNFGLAASIIDGVTTMLAHHENVIVVEDDLLVSPHFLAYMNDGLARYAGDVRVASIHAYIYPLARPMPETFFLRGADCWGWATWRRAWQHFNPDGAALLAQLQSCGLVRDFDYGGVAAFTEMLANQIAGHNNSWAIRWHAAAFLDGLLTLYPGRSLVHNIGNDGSGTHCSDDAAGHFGREVATTPVTVGPIAVEESAIAREAVADYFRRARPGSFQRGISKLKQMIKAGRACALRAAGRALRTLPWTRRLLVASCDYRIVTEAQARAHRGGGWHFASTVRRQEQAYDNLLADMHRGQPRNDLTVAAQAVDALGLASLTLLEIGCGSAYYVEVFDALCRSKVIYMGLDYSAAMIERAQRRYPKATFVTGDATRLDLPDNAFDIVFNGVSLMHILDFEKAIAEAERVAAKAVIFHSVPLLERHQTTYLTKYAYGAPVVEVTFNRAHLLEMFARHGLEVQQSWFSEDYDVAEVVGETSRAETFLCRPAS